MTLSWLAFGILAAGAGGFAAWIYVRRELPIRGQRFLGAIRASIFVLVLLLLWDPRLPGRSQDGSAAGRWVLLDGSISMSTTASEGGGNWASAVERARELAEGGAQILLFGETPRVVPIDSLDALVPDAPSSHLAPAFARAAEAGATRVTVLSDLRLDDPLEAEAGAGRSAFGLQVERVGEAIRNAGVSRFQLPSRAVSGEPFSAEVAVFSEETVSGDTIFVEVYEEERLVYSGGVLPAEPGLLATATIRLPAPGDAGWRRYRLITNLPGDRFEADDAKSAFTEVDPGEGGLVLLSLLPDWEPRFLLPVLAQITGLDASGFLAMSGGKFLRLNTGAQIEPPVDEAEVRAALSGADMVVVHGLGAGAPEWVTTSLSEALTSIVFPADPAGARASGVEVGSHLQGEWYASPDLPPSVLAASFSGADLTGLPPLTDVLPRQTTETAPTPIPLQRQGAGPAEAGLVLDENQGRRRAVVLASGFWRWAFREGADREAYRRLWAGVSGWLLASAPSDGSGAVGPAKRVWTGVAGPGIDWSRGRRHARLGGFGCARYDRGGGWHRRGTHEAPSRCRVFVPDYAAGRGRLRRKWPNRERAPQLRPLPPTRGPRHRGAGRAPRPPGRPDARATAPYAPRFLPSDPCASLYRVDRSPSGRLAIGPVNSR